MIREESYKLRDDLTMECEVFCNTCDEWMMSLNWRISTGDLAARNMTHSPMVILKNLFSFPSWVQRSVHSSTCTNHK